MRNTRLSSISTALLPFLGHGFQGLRLAMLGSVLE
jgi:hypothetical protein